MTSYVIEKGIPAPSARGKYPFAQMEVGDSFFVPDKTTATFGGVLSHARKRTGFGFVMRSENGGLRVWRVS